MIAWAISNLQGVVAIIEFLALVAMGILAFTGAFSSKDSLRRDESDSIADGLIKRLQLTVEQNVKDMALMGERVDAQQKEIHQLQGQNEAYLKIITLRDPAVAKVFEAAPEIHTIIRETGILVKKQVDATAALTKAMEEFINRLPPLMPAIHP